MIRDSQAETLKTEKPQPFVSGGKGTVLSHTIVMDAPAGFEEQAPYTLALVKLDDGPTVLAQLTDLEGPAVIGMHVEMVHPQAAHRWQARDHRLRLQVPAAAAALTRQDCERRSLS